MTDPIVTAALVTGIFTLGAGLVGGVFFIWRREPQRNGLMGQMAEALVQVAAVTERMNAAHEEYLRRMDDQDKRNRTEHEAMLKAMRELTDIVAPRRFGAKGG